VDIERELKMGGLMFRSPEQRQTWAAAAGRAPKPAPPPAPASTDEIVCERFTPANGGRQVVKMKFDGTNVRALSASTFDGTPAWSPDRRKIVFARSLSANTPSQLWTMNADGSGARQLTNPPAGMSDLEAIWSPDGTKIAFQRFYQIWIVDASGANARPLDNYTNLNVIDHMPTWNQASTEIAFCRQYSGNGVIASKEIQGATPTKSLTQPLSSRIDGWPAWSPSGNPILFWRNDGHDSKIWAVDSTGTGERPVTSPGNGYDQAPCWSPDGDKIAFHRTEWVIAHIWVAAPDGSNAQDISAVGNPFGNPADYVPNWA
jgi:TolB protein